MNLNCGYTLCEINIEDIMKAYIVCICATFDDINFYIANVLFPGNDCVYIEFEFNDDKIFSLLGDNEYIMATPVNNTKLFSLATELDNLNLNINDSIKFNINGLVGNIKIIDIVPEKNELPEIDYENTNDDDYYENIIEVFLNKY